jgi:hypothetical protein
MLNVRFGAGAARPHQNKAAPCGFGYATPINAAYLQTMIKSNTYYNICVITHNTNNTLVRPLSNACWLSLSATSLVYN